MADDGMVTVEDVLVVSVFLMMFSAVTLGLGYAFLRRDRIAEFAVRHLDEFPWSMQFRPRHLWDTRSQALDWLTLQLGCFFVVFFIVSAVLAVSLVALLVAAIR